MVLVICHCKVGFRGRRVAAQAREDEAQFRGRLVRVRTPLE